MDPNKLFQNIRLGWSPFVVIAVTTLATIAISIYCLLSGLNIIFQNLFYVPVIIACMIYTKKGFVFSVVLSFIYLFLIIAFNGDSTVIIEALTRVLIFIGVAGITTLLSAKLNQAEEARRQSEATVRALINNAPEDSILLLDIRGVIVDVNQIAAERSGKSRIELIGTYADNALPEDVAKSRRSVISQIMETGKSVRFEDKRGDSWFDTVAFPILNKDNAVSKIAVFARDITERKRVEEELLKNTEELNSAYEELVTSEEELRLNLDDLVRSEERFRTLLRNAPFGLVMILENGTINFTNPKFREIFGYEPEDIPDGRTWSMKAYPDAAYRHEVISVWKGDLEKSVVGEQRPRVFTATCKDGSAKTIKFIPVMLTTGDHIMACEDITDRILAEEEKRNLEERLSRAEKMEALGTLAGGVAHDLNNVLGIVVGYAELILNDVDNSSPIREHIETIYNGGMRAAAMIDDMLTMARRGVHNRQILNLNKVIMDVKKSPELIQLAPQHSSVQIKIDLDPDLLNISCSQVHVAKLLFNLILNAFEAMPNGGGLTVSTSNQCLEKPVKGYDEVRRGDYVVLSVSDTGEGIKAADLKRIFEPFYTKKIMGRSGTGLGLSVVWSTVKDHNGYIDVQSEEGKGSAFTLYFPVSREEITAERASVSIAEYIGKGESILVVDDVKGQRDLATGMLRKLNYNVSSVSSGEEAVDYLKDHEVDLLVLDMIMEPGMDGLDTYKSVLEIRPKQKAIIVSGFSETDRVNAAHELGAGAYVKKPYVMEKLGLAVKKELDRRP